MDNEKDNVNEELETEKLQSNDVETGELGTENAETEVIENEEHEADMIEVDETHDQTGIPGVVVDDEVIGEKKSLNKTLVIVGAIVVLAVLVMVGLGIKNYIDSSNNDLTIDKTFYTAFFYSTQAQIEQTKALQTPEQKIAYWADSKNVADLKKQSLDFMIKQEVTFRKAKEAGITLTPEEIAKAKSDTEASLLQQGGTIEDASKNLLLYYHVNLDQFKEIFVTMALTNKYQTDLTTKTVANISDADAKAYFEANPSKYKNVKATQIALFATDSTGKPLTPAKLAENKKLANSLLAQINKNKGADMAKLAVKYSSDPSAKQSKGVINITEGDTQNVPDVVSWVLSAKQGDVKLLDTQYGIFIVKVDQISTMNFENTKAQIKDTMAKEKIPTIIDGFVASASKVIRNQAELDQILPAPPPPAQPTAVPAAPQATLAPTIKPAK